MLVQLGGLEPPTSCSTDRRSNQLSYNCILCEAPKGVANSAETRCNAPLWQGRKGLNCEGKTPQSRSPDPARRNPGQVRSGARSRIRSA